MIINFFKGGDTGASYTSGWTAGFESGETIGIEQGYASGYSEGYSSGETDGYQSGFESGETQGFDSGYTEGYQSGSTDGYADGYSSGSSDGYYSGLTEGYDTGYEEAGETTQAMIDGSVSSITISTAITEIRAGAFKDTNLTSVIIPASVTSIGDGAFEGCSGLTSIEIKSDVPPTISENTFSGSSCPIYVPDPQTYEDAWSAYTETTPRIEDGSIYDPLTFVVLTAGNIVFKNNSEYATTTGKTIEYSKNGGAWTSINSKDATAIPVVQGDKVQFRGDNDTMALYVDTFDTTGATFQGTTCSFNLKGNIMSLLDSTGFTVLTTMVSAGTFAYMFAGDYNSTVNVVDASMLYMPALNITSQAYTGMFNGCTAMTAAPRTLPATVVDYRGYHNMFSDCQSLTDAPTIMATAITGDEAFRLMFNNCINLTGVQETLYVTSLWRTGMQSMFEGCSSLTTAPALPATALADFCYMNMFDGCGSLVNAPVLSAATLARMSYYQMFNNCSSLSSITCLATDLGNQGTGFWVAGVAQTGTFIKDPNMTGWTTGTNGIPNGWTVQDYGAPAYEPVEYIRSNGGSWNKYEAIDTGIYPSTGLTLRIVYGGRGVQSGRLCGVSWEDMHDSYDESYDAEQFMRFFPHYVGNFFDLNGGRLTVNGVDLTDWTTHDFTLGNFYVKSGSTVLTSDTAYSTLSYTGHPIMVDVSCINLEGFEIYDGNTCVFSGVPAYISGETPAVGLYDLVSNELFTNSAVTFVYSSGGSEYTASTESGGDENECPEGMHWDDGIGDCVMDDVPDPCEGMSQEECDCMQAGGTWDPAANEGMGECIYPEG